MAGGMFTHADMRGISRGQCTSIGCDCDGFTRPSSLDACRVQAAVLPCGWCSYCGHSPVNHSRVAENSAYEERTQQVDVSHLSGVQENLEQHSTPEADPHPEPSQQPDVNPQPQQEVTCISESDKPRLKLEPADSKPERNSELKQSSQSELCPQQGTSPQPETSPKQEQRSPTPTRKRHDKEEALTCSRIVARSLKRLEEKKAELERQRDYLDAEDIPDAELRTTRLLLDIRRDQCDSNHELKQIRHNMQLLLDGQARLEASSNQNTHSLQPSPVRLPKMPAETLEEFEALEEAVQDDDVAAALREHLLQFGGSNLREVATTVMKRIMGHKVQLLYSLHGKKGKKAFIDMRICSIATDIICRKQKADVAEVLAFIRRWLPGSIDRCGGRKRCYEEDVIGVGSSPLQGSTPASVAIVHSSSHVNF